MSTQKLAQEPRVSAQAVQSLTNMQPGSSNGAIARECEALAEAKRLKALAPQPSRGQHQNLSHLGRTDNE